MTAASLVISLSAVLLLGTVLALGDVGHEDEAAQSATAGAQDRVALHVGPEGCDDARAVEAVRDPATPWCSLDRAVEAAPAGTDVAIALGTYPVLKLPGDRRERDLRFRAADPAAPPQLAGAQLSRVRGVRLARLVFTGTVSVRSSADVVVQDSHFASANLYVRQSRRVGVLRNRFRDVRDGERALLAQGAIRDGEPTTEDLVVRDNVFENIAHDAIAVYNGYRRVTVEGNRITRVWRPSGAEYHSDAMQFMGGDRLTIRRNVLWDNNQGILIKDGRATTRLRVVRNLVTGGGAGLQIFNAPRAEVARNTIWDTRFGTIFRNVPSLPGRTSVRLEANVLDQLIVDAGTEATAMGAGNVFGGGTTYGSPSYLGEPRFRRARDGDFRIRSSRPGAGIPLGTPPGAQMRVP